MKAADQRKQFDALLNDSKDSMGRLLAKAPDFPPYLSIGRQLRALSLWTQDGKMPTREQRLALDFQVVAVRELESNSNPEVQQLVKKLYQLAYDLKRLS
ncbi:MAG TPA: hypothetical protein VGL89_08510 [Candidatus Koribacter sp.]|jgi:hypothetical protein